MAAPREPRYLELAPTLLPNGMQVSVHTSPRLLAGELASVLPAHRSALDGARILATAQRAAVDLVQIGPDVEKEKDRLLETVRVCVHEHEEDVQEALAPTAKIFSRVPWGLAATHSLAFLSCE